MAGITKYSDGSMFNNTNLKAYYKCNADFTDFGPNAWTLNNISGSPPTFVSGGVYNNTSHFVAASTQYAGIGNNFGINGGWITVSCFVRFTSQPAGGASMNVFFQSNAGAKIAYIINYYGTGPRLSFGRWKTTASVQEATVNMTLSNATWYHVVLTYDYTTSLIAGYVNGALVAGPTTASGDGSVSQGSGVFLSYPNSPCTVINGDIDEVIIFDRTWNTQEVYNYWQKYAATMMSGLNW